MQDHQATVAKGPTWPTIALLPDKPILDSQHVVRKSLFVEQVTEAATEFVVLVVNDLEQPVLDAKRVAKVVTQLVAGDLGRPAREVAAVEQLLPGCRLRRFALLCEGRGGEDRDGEENTESVWIRPAEAVAEFEQALDTPIADWVPEEARLLSDLASRRAP